VRKIGDIGNVAAVFVAIENVDVIIFHSSPPRDRSYGDAQVIVQELGGEIGPIRPDEGVKFGMNLELTKDGGIAQQPVTRSASTFAAL